MADPTTLQVSLPGAGKTQTYQLSANSLVKFGFDISEAVFTGSNGNLEIAIEGGGTVILEGYQALADSGQLPTFEMMDGEQVAGDVYLFAFAEGAETTEEELETAADGAAGGSGAGTYSDDPGSLFDGLNALGGQGDAYDAASLEAIPGVVGADNLPPDATDDENSIIELGPENVASDPYNLPGSTTGNVLLNDSDPEGGPLTVTRIDFVGAERTGIDDTDIDGQEVDPEAVTADDTVAQGRYGTLRIDPDGDYTYVLDQDETDFLRPGQTLEEVFEYTIQDDAGLTDSAFLTVTIIGNNDNPDIIIDPRREPNEDFERTAGGSHRDANFVEDGVGQGSGLVDAFGRHASSITDVDNDPSELTLMLMLGNPLGNDDDVPIWNNPLENDILGFDTRGPLISTVDGDASDGETSYLFRDLEVTINHDNGTVFMEAVDGSTPAFEDFQHALKHVTFGIDPADHTPVDGPREFKLIVRDDNSVIEDPFEIADGIFSEDGYAEASFTLFVNATNDRPVAVDDGIFEVTELSDVIHGGCDFGFLGGAMGQLFGDGFRPLPDLPPPAPANVTTGNVLLNDWDPDQYSYDNSGSVASSEDNANDLHALRVVGFMAGDAGGAPGSPPGPSDLPDGPGIQTLSTTPTSYTTPGDTLADNVFVQGTYGKLYMDDEGNFRYVAEGEASDTIAAGHFATETFTYMIQDGDDSLGPDGNPYNNPATDAATVTFKIYGSNDSAEIIYEEGADAGLVTEIDWVEDPAVDPNDRSTWGADSPDADDFGDSIPGQLDQFGNVIVNPAVGLLTASGSMSVDDPDDHTVGSPVSPPTHTDPVNESTFQVVTNHTNPNGYGTFSITADGDWSYSIDNTLDAVQQLGEGETMQEHFTVSSYDGTASHVITVTVAGSNDAPVITSVHALPIEDFESGSSGWDSGETTTFLGNTFLGWFGQGESTGKTYQIDPDADTVTIEFDMFEHGAWDPSLTNWFDTDNFTIEVGGHTVNIPLNVFSSESYSQTFGDGSSFSLTPLDNTGGYFFHRVSISIPAPAGGEMTIDLSANIETEWFHTFFGSFPIDVEAFGIDNVSVTSFDGVLPTTSLLENVSGDTAVARLGSEDIDGDAVSYSVTKVFIIGDNGRVEVDSSLFSMVGNTLVAHGGDGGFDHEAHSEYYAVVLPTDGMDDGQDVVIKVQIGDVNEPPIGEDFVMYVGEEGALVPFAADAGDDLSMPPDHVWDPEDDEQSLDVMLTALPERGTLFYDHDGDPNTDPIEITPADLAADTNNDGVPDAPQFNLQGLSYVPDGDAPSGVMLGTRIAEDADIDNWGAAIDAGTRTLDLGDGVTVTTSVTSGGEPAELWQYQEHENPQGQYRNHIGFGLADKRGEGLNDGAGNAEGDVLTMTFNGATVGYAEIGIDGMHGHYNDDGRAPLANAVWEASLGGDTVAYGSANNMTMTWYVKDDTGTWVQHHGGDGNGDLFQKLILTGFQFDTLAFSTESTTSGSNWELRYVDAEFTDSFDYIPIDSGGLIDPNGSSTVTIMPTELFDEDPTAIPDAGEVWEPNEDGLVSSVSANVLDNDLDLDNTAGELSVTKVVFKGVEYDFETTDPITIPGDHGTLTIGSDGEYTYTATDETMKPGDMPTETFTYTMTDGDTVDNDPVAQSANLVITVNGLNDPPVAINDSGRGVGSATGGGEGGNTAYSLLAQEFDPDSGGGEWVSADLVHWGQNFGVHSSEDNVQGGQDRQIENVGVRERIGVQFEAPQSEVVLTVTNHGGGEEMIAILDAQGNYIANGLDPNDPTPLSIAFHGNTITVSYAGGSIGTVYLMAPDDANGNNRPDVALKSVSSTPADVIPGEVDPVVVEGNVLANDWDYEDMDYPESGPYPNGSTELKVTGATDGNYDDLSQAQYDTLLTAGKFNPDSGTFDLDDDGTGATVQGQYGVLVIDEDGNYTYTANSTLEVGDYSETFTYQVSDTNSAVDYGLIEISVDINNDPPVAGDDLSEGLFVTTVDDPATYAWIAGEQTGMAGMDFTLDNGTGGREPFELTYTDGGWGLDTGQRAFWDPIRDESDEFDAGHYKYKTGIIFKRTHEGDYDESVSLEFDNARGQVDITLGKLDHNDGVTIIAHFSDGSSGDFSIAGHGGGGIVDQTVQIYSRDAAGSGASEKLITSITLSPADTNSSFNIKSIVGYEPSTLDGTPGGTHLEADPITGFVLPNDYDPNSDPMTVALLGTGVGVWGTLEIINAATGEYRYTPDTDAMNDGNGGLTAPMVEQFTYLVDDGLGGTDTATLYIPVHLDATPTTSATAGSDIIYGSENVDQLMGSDGNDFLYGRDGDDFLRGEADNDYVSGGAGGDTIDGGAGNDMLFGDAGDDAIHLSDGSDTVSLGEGADKIIVDPSVLSGNANLEVTDFDLNGGDLIDVSALTTTSVGISAAVGSGDLLLTITDGNDITIILNGVINPTHDGISHTVNLTTDNLNDVIQQIIDSPDQY